MSLSKKKQRKVELLKVQIDFMWKLFLVVNGVFIVTLARSFQLKSDPSFGESLILLTCIIYGGVAILFSGVICRMYFKLFKILSKK